MSGRSLSPTTYATVFAVLACLTVLTVGVSFIPLSGTWHVVLGLVIATGKATLVLLFFMHLLESTSLVRIVVAVAVAFMAILLSLTYADYFTRGNVPYMPGH